MVALSAMYHKMTGSSSTSNGDPYVQPVDEDNPRTSSSYDSISSHTSTNGESTLKSSSKEIDNSVLSTRDSDHRGSTSNTCFTQSIKGGSTSIDFEE